MDDNTTKTNIHTYMQHIHTYIHTETNSKTMHQQTQYVTQQECEEK